MQQGLPIDRGTAVSELATKCQIILDLFTKNKLKANPDKFQYIFYGTRQQLAKISPESKTILIQDTLIKAIPTVKKLGMKFDQNLTWNEHITDLKRSSAGKLIQISKLRGSMTKEALGNLVSATVMSRVSYGDIEYDTASKNVTNKAQIIQNFAAIVIAGVPKREHATPLIHNLGWMRQNQLRS